MNQNRPKSATPPPPQRRKRDAPRTIPTPALEVDEEIAAAVEAQLAAQRAELTAKLMAEKAARLLAEAEEERQRQRAIAARAKADFTPEQIERFQALLVASGLQVVPRAIPVPPKTPDGTAVVPDRDYSDTERVQIELNALLDLMGVVTVRDVQEHVRREDGNVMTPSNVRYHMKKLANRGIVKKAEETYTLPGLGARTRDVWSKDPQKLLEVLEGKRTVRS